MHVTYSLTTVDVGLAVLSLTSVTILITRSDPHCLESLPVIALNVKYLDHGEKGMQVLSSGELYLGACLYVQP